MPPRSRKRKGLGLSRYGKRRRVQRRGGRYVRSVRRRSYKRPRRFRRFKRKFRRSRRTKRSSNYKKKLEFALSDLRTAAYVYGQQHTVPNSNSDVECVYFITEQVDLTHTHPIETITRPLQGIADVLNVADRAWVVTPNNAVAGLNQGWTTDVAFGNLFLRGTDKYEIRNQSNEVVKLTCYTCTCRQDTQFRKVPTTDPGPPITTSSNNIYNYLGTGFAENGMDINNQTATNAYLQRDQFTPFNSRYFCRHFKINKVSRMIIAPGGIRSMTLVSRWRKHTPADYVENTGSGTSWATRSRIYDDIKGERFILFKLHGNIGGIDLQSTMEKEIGQTTPTVIMKTVRKYQFKHISRPNASTVDFTITGFDAGTASIIVDDDEKKGAEIDAS